MKNPIDYTFFCSLIIAQNDFLFKKGQSLACSENGKVFPHVHVFLDLVPIPPETMKQQQQQQQHFT